MRSDLNPNYKSAMYHNQVRVYHQERGMLYPGQFRIKYNRDKMFYLLLPGDPNKPYEKPADWVMQRFTGLKDKNGVKIYEGDIVSAPFDQWQALVVFRSARFELDGNEFVNQTNFQEHPEVYSVVGNVYEHSEVLTQGATNEVF